MVFHQLLQTGPVYLGSTLAQYAAFFTVVTAAALIGRTVSYIIERHLQRHVDATRTQLDDVLIEVVGRPIMFVAVTIGAVLGQYVLTPTTFFATILDAGVKTLVIIAATWLGIRFVDGFVHTYLDAFAARTDSALDDQLVPVLRKTVKAAIIIVALLVALDSFGYDVTALIASLGIGGLALAFAAKETLADIFGGFSIFTGRPFVVGDAVDIGDVSGEVEEVGLRFTRIRTWDKQLVTIPNSKVASSNILNVSAEPARRVVQYLGLTYDHDHEDVADAINVTRDTINTVDGVDTEKTRVWFWEYGESSLKLRVQYYIADLANKWDVKHQVNMQIKQAWEDNGFEMAFPTRTVHIQDT